MRAGDRLGSYAIQRELARGGMGAVFLAQHVETGALVALKRILVEVADDETARRFEREAQVLARLRHPAIVPVHEARFGDPAYMVQAYLPGGTLAERLRGGPLGLDEALRVVRRVGAGLAHAHAQGIVHRDLKPANVLFDERGEACLADFGLAGLSGAGRLTATGEVLGTPGFMAPEQADDARGAGIPADVYALGALLYTCLAGRGPFAHHRGLVQQLHAVLHEEPASLRGVRPDVPPAVEAVCVAALDKEPGRRPQTVGAFLAELETPRPASAGLRVSARWGAWVTLLLAGVALAWFRAALPPSAERPPTLQGPTTPPVGPLERALGELARGGSLHADQLNQAGDWLAAGADLTPIRSRLAALPRSGDRDRLWAWAIVLAGDLDELAAWDPPDVPQPWSPYRQLALDLAALAAHDLDATWEEGLDLALDLVRDASPARLGTGPVGEAARDRVQAAIAYLIARATRDGLEFSKARPLITNALELQGRSTGRGELLAAAAYARARRVAGGSADRELLELLSQAADHPSSTAMGVHWRAYGEARWRTQPEGRWAAARGGSQALRRRALEQLERGQVQPEWQMSDRALIELSLGCDALAELWRGLRDSSGDRAAWRDRAPRATPGEEFQRLWGLIDAQVQLLLGSPVQVERLAVGADAPARAEAAVVEGEAALVADPPDLERALARFQAAIDEEGDPPADALLGRLHVRVLLGRISVEQALTHGDVELARRRVRVAAGAFWHLPADFEGTLRGGWWPGAR